VVADVANALKLVLAINDVPHFDAESRAVDFALEKERTIGGFIGPFVKKIGEASLTICVAFGGTGKSICGSRSAGRRRRTSRGCIESWRTNKVDAEMRFCFKIKKLGSKHQGHREWYRERMGQYETQVDTCVVPEEGSEVVTREACLPLFRKQKRWRATRKINS